MQPQPPPNVPVPLKGMVGKDITKSGYARSNSGRWTWGQGGSSTAPASMKAATVDTNHAAPAVTRPAKELKITRAASSKNIVGSEFKDAGQSGNLEIWRVENMTAKPIPKDQYGKFYTGDAYIVLSGDTTSSFHIHFWIGKESSQDKYGTAAYKTVELDNKFTGSAIHHREEQEKESEMFKAYFKGTGFEYLEGGSASAFRHVIREVFPKRLLHIKGRRSVRVKQVDVTYKSLNLGDVFVLDVGRTIFQWNAPQANRTERVKAVEIIRNIKDNERGGRATIVVVEHSEQENVNKQNKKAEQFWEALGDKGPIADAESAGDDDQFEKTVASELILHKIYDERSQVKVEEDKTRPLKKEILDSHNAYVLDASTEVFCWLGKSTSANQKTFASDFAKKIHSEKPPWVQLVKIVQGAETPLFKEKFDNWKHLFPKNLDYGASSQLLPSLNSKKIEAPKEEIDYEKLITTKYKGRAENALIHAGNGVLKIWKIEDFKKVELPESQHGIFFSSSCYICLYVEVKDQRRSHYIYFWQGRHSTKETKGTSALLAKEMADTIRGKQQQFRIVHNKEPEHFVMLFKGKMIVGMGLHPKTREDLGGLYHVKHLANSLEWNVKACQVPMTSESLNSNDVFVLVTTDRKCFVWNGVGSSSWERKVAKLAAARLMGDANVGKITSVDEGKEVSYFWQYFPNGKKEYACAEYLKWNSKSPRLFQCSNTTGAFKIEEIYNFTQEDLDSDDPFILDCYAEVFVWVGAGSNEAEKKFAMQAALEYVSKAATLDERDPSTPIYYVTPNEEPIQFKCHFLAWDNDLVAATKKDDDDDGSPLKCSVLMSSFKPASFNPDAKPLYPPLKPKQAADPNRPKISFYHPPAGTTTPTAPEPKPAAEPKPVISYSFPKPAATTPSDPPPSTTPRGTVVTTTITPRSLPTSTSETTTPRARSNSANKTLNPQSKSPRTSSPRASEPPVETAPTTVPTTVESSAQVTEPQPTSTQPTQEVAHSIAEPTSQVAPPEAPQSQVIDSPAQVPPTTPAWQGTQEPVTAAPIATTTTPPVASKPATKPGLAINLSSLASGSVPASTPSGSGTPSATTAPTTPAAEDSGPITPGRSVRPPWIKTRAETTKLMATLLPPSKPVVVAVLTPTTTPSAAQEVPSTTNSTTAETETSVSTQADAVPITADTVTPSKESATTASNAHVTTSIAPAPCINVAASINAAIFAGHSPATASITAAISATTTPAQVKTTTITAPVTTDSTSTTSTNTSTDLTPVTTTVSSTTTIPATVPSTTSAASASAEQKLKSSQEFQKVTLKKPPAQIGLVQVELAKYNREFYSLAELTARKKPPGVDVTCLEKYLVDEEFQQVFGMTKDKFYAISVWKRVTMRKDKQLY